MNKYIIVRIYFPFLVCLLSAQLAKGQSLKEGFPYNTKTGRIAIIDSVKVGPGYSQSWLNDIVDEWANYTAYACMHQKLIWLAKGVSVGFQFIYEDENEKGQFYKRGQISYLAPDHKSKTTPDGKMNGAVIFGIYFKYSGVYARVEFTHFYYAGPKNELGNFEDKKLLGPDGVKLLSEKEKPWNEIRKVYFSWTQLICRNLKEYIANNSVKKLPQH